MVKVRELINFLGYLAEYYALHDGRLAAMHVWRDVQDGLERSPDKAGLLKSVSAGSHPQVRALLDQAEGADDPIIVDSLTMVDLPQWSKGRVLLVGDAAHCLTLVSGQGAGMALASVEMLAQALMENGDTATALARHEARLRPIIGRLQARSRKMATIFIPQSPFAFRLRNFVMRHMPRALLGRYFSNAIRSEIELARVRPN